MVDITTLDKDWYKPSEVASMLNMSPSTIRNYINDGRLAVRVDGMNNRFYIARDSVVEFLKQSGLAMVSKGVAIYVRGLSVERQLERLEIFCRCNDVFDYKVYSDVSLMDKSGLKQLCQDVMDGKISKVYITHKDRISRFEFDFIELFFKHFGAYIVIVGDDSEEEIHKEYVDDVLSIMDALGGVDKIEASL